MGVYERAFKAGFEPDPDWTITEWADRRRIIAKGASPEYGPYRSSRTPYVRAIMDELSPSSPTQKVIAVKPTQDGHTELANNVLMGYADLYPCQCLFVMPTDKMVEKHSKKKIAPAVEVMPCLKGKVADPKSRDSKNTIRMKEFPGGSWTFTGSDSPIAARSDSVKVVILDDFDGCSDDVGGEGDPMALYEKRTDAYGRKSKIYANSTPTLYGASKIWAEYEKSSQGVYHVKCPHCKKWIFLDWNMDLDPWLRERKKKPKGGVRYKKDQDGQAVDVHYICQECGKRIEEHHKSFMLLPENGKYIHRHSMRKVKGFRNNALVSPLGWVSWEQIAQEWIDAQGSRTKLKVWTNTRMARTFKEQIKERSELGILALRDDRPRGRVPGNGIVCGLVAGVDTQDDGFWYRIRAFGYGGVELLKESWGIREGFVTTWGALEQVLWKDKYRDPDGNEYPVLMAIQDALGHRTAEVYKFCVKHRGQIFPSFGRDRMATPFGWTNLEFYPGKKKPIRGGLKGLNVNTKYFKDDLSSILEIAKGDPGAWNENSEFNSEWAKHMTAEYINQKGMWECPDGKDNHLWDCAVLCMVAHEVLGMVFWEKPEPTPEAQAHADGGRRVRSRGI